MAELDEDYSQWDRKWGESNADFGDRKRREHAQKEREDAPRYPAANCGSCPYPTGCGAVCRLR